MKNIYILCIYTFFLCHSFALQAQNNLGDPQGQDQKSYIKMLYDNELYKLCYGVSEESRGSLMKKHDPSLETDMSLLYYYLSSGIRIDALDIIPKVEKSLDDKNLPKVYYQRLCLDMGNYYFQAGEYNKALAYMMNAGAKFLTEEELSEKNFVLAYIYFLESDFEQAKYLFASIKDEHGPYIYDANYYYGLISFGEGNYSEALESFRYIEKYPKYRNIVPYYIAEIYYYDGDLNNCINYSLKALEDDSTSYKESLHALLAQAYFEQGNYSKSIQEFNTAMDMNYQMANNQYYTLGYSYYMQSDIEEAIEFFKPLSEEQDSLGQNAMYLLADCYLQEEDIASAKNAFRYCKDLNYNPVITENSHFNFIKSNYALGQYHDALRSIEIFKETYPNSKYNNETNTLAANIFLSSGNYERAWEILAPDSNSSDEYLQQLLQKVALQNAKALLNNYKNLDAIDFLNFIHRRNYNPGIRLETNLWLGEAYTRLDDYPNAISYSRYYINHVSQQEYLNKSIARYNLAYCYLQTQEADSAIIFAKQNVDQLPEYEYDLRSLSMTRIGDAYFMLNDYPNASYWYDKSEEDNPNKDYIYFQKARLAGLNNQQYDQIKQLEIIAADESNPYRNKAVFELGEVYFNDYQYTKAIDKYESSIELNYNIPQSYYKIGLSYESLNKNEDALTNYKLLLTDYPNAAEKPLAIEQSKQIFINEGRIDDLREFLDEYDMSSETANTLDSSSYYAAEKFILSEDYPSAQKAFEDYLENFPNGFFVINAHYYLAESLQKQGEYEDALKTLNQSGVNPSSEFYDNIMLVKADIYREDLHDTVRGDQALKNILEFSSNIPNRVLAAQTLLDDYFEIDDFASYSELFKQLSLTNSNNEIIPKSIFMLMQAKQDLLQEDWADAAPLLDALFDLKETPYTDEAIYLKGWSLLKQNKVKAADDYMMEALKYNYVADYWNLRYYLLLADIFIAEDDKFNARATLSSLIDDSGNDEIIYRAKQKLEQL